MLGKNLFKIESGAGAWKKEKPLESLSKTKDEFDSVLEKTRNLRLANPDKDRSGSKLKHKKHDKESDPKTLVITNPSILLIPMQKGEGMMGTNEGESIGQENLLDISEDLDETQWIGQEMIESLNNEFVGGELDLKDDVIAIGQDTLDEELLPEGVYIDFDTEIQEEDMENQIYKNQLQDELGLDIKDHNTDEKTIQPQNKTDWNIRGREYMPEDSKENMIKEHHSFGHHKDIIETDGNLEISSNLGDDFNLKMVTSMEEENKLQGVIEKDFIESLREKTLTEKNIHKDYGIEDASPKERLENEGFNMAQTPNDSTDISFSKEISEISFKEPIRAVGDIAKIMATIQSSNKTQLEVLVHPKHLGKIILKVSIEEGSLVGRISASTNEVRDILQSNIDKLETALGEQGLEFATLDVNVSEREGQNSFNQGHYSTAKVKKVKTQTSFLDTQALDRDVHSGTLQGIESNSIDYLA